tara:strand:- start:3102 stop:3632 length:531 start_codon:yes stop_codon:yes gene_type:complete
MWFSILKQPQLGMANVGLVDLSNVPEEEESKVCWPKLKKGLKYLDSKHNMFNNIVDFKWEEIPEEIACAVIKLFHNAYYYSDNPPTIIGDYTIKVDYYMDDEVWVDISVEHKDNMVIKYYIETEYGLLDKPETGIYRLDWKYNREIYDIVSKFLEIIEQKILISKDSFYRSWGKEK